MNKPLIEVHNAWTVHGMNPDGTKANNPLATFGRPQDWGDPRWVYHRYIFTWHSINPPHTNHCHCWTDLKLEPHQYPTLFASLITQINVPGRPAWQCGREFLAEEDFWLAAWGPQPPFYDEDAELARRQVVNVQLRVIGRSQEETTESVAVLQALATDEVRIAFPPARSGRRGESLAYGTLTFPRDITGDTTK